MVRFIGMKKIVALVSAAVAVLGGCTGVPKGSPDDNGGSAYAALLTAKPTTPSEAAALRTSNMMKTMFVVVLENHNWSDLKGNASAPYLNNVLLPMGAHAEAYFDNPKAVHPSEPNYIWMEAGDNLAIQDDDDPDVNHRTTKMHLVSLLNAANVPWTSYQENISGTGCPVAPSGLYAPRHNPAVFFDDVSSDVAYCEKHVRPFAELAGDLAAGRVSGYVFITPNLCDDMHDSQECVTGDAMKNGDSWLATQIPALLGSTAYQSGGAIFITWDESEGGEVPIGMVALSPYIRPGYSSSTHFTHSSLLRTAQNVFGVRPYLRDAANVKDLGELFTQFP